MDDIIHLLPDSVANQIAAGEVVQRPASAVKELLENAIDAGAQSIQIIIKDAGRTLIQVIDDGKGMSFNDARLCFERHATSKISCANDLFSLKTKGFRGEALASIAAIAQVELKTRRQEDEMGTQVLIEGSEIKEHSLTTTAVGTSIAVKNLFYNVPARRNFLKSDATELSNIEEEFHRVALIHPQIAFTFYHNGKMMRQLLGETFKQRIISIFGNHYQEKLFPIEQQTEYMSISGYLGKAENAKKKRGEQYLFINHRFVKHNGLAFAIESAYNQIIPEGYHPAFFICLEVNPATIDVNISPTKVEIKLQEERLVFGFLNAAVKKAIGEFSLIPQLDFDYNTELDINNIPENSTLKIPTISINTNYNPFKSTQYESGRNRPTPKPVDSQEWNNFWENIQKTPVTEEMPAPANELPLEVADEDGEKITIDHFLLVHNKFLLVKAKEELLLVDIIRANERIIYDKYLSALNQTPIAVQQSLFPETITLTPAKADLLMELRDDLLNLGYEIELISNGQFAVNATPHDEESGDLQSLIENMLDDYQSNMLNHRLERDRNIALALSKQKRSQMKPMNSVEEVENFLNILFHSMMPSVTPSGEKVYEVLNSSTLDKLLNN